MFKTCLNNFCKSSYFGNVYSFCRWADDLGDEIGDPLESLRLLRWWREELEAMYRGEVKHPVFVALEGTARKYGLPKQLFDDLISAFEQDQAVTRYANWDGLFGYCRRSANPVGRLVLRLCGYDDPERDRLSDATCTALQLANFWQDVTVDLQKDRIYLPLDVMARHGYSLEELQALKFTRSSKVPCGKLSTWRESCSSKVIGCQRPWMAGSPSILNC